MIELGSRIETTGAGRTSAWKGWTGTVTNIIDHLVPGSSVRVYTVQMDEDGLAPVELREHELRLQYSFYPTCPCSNCSWTRNHPAR